MRAATSTSEALINPRKATMASAPESKSCTRCWGNYEKAQQMCSRKHTERKKVLSNIVDSNQGQIIPKSLDDNLDFLRIAKATFNVQRDVIEAQKQQKYEFDTKEKLEKFKENDCIWNKIVGERNDHFDEYLHHKDKHSIDNKTKKVGAKLTDNVDEDKHLVKFDIRDFAENLKDSENVSEGGSIGYHSDVTDINTCMDTLSASIICDSKQRIAHWAEGKSNDFLKQLNNIITDTGVPSHKKKIHNEAREATTKQKTMHITRKDQLKNYGCEEMFTKFNSGSRDDSNKDFNYLFPQLLISEETDPQVSSSELIQKTREVLDAQLAEKARKISIENRKRKEFESLERDKKLKILGETEASKEKAYKEIHYDLDEKKMSYENLEEVSLEQDKSKRETSIGDKNGQMLSEMTKLERKKQAAESKQSSDGKKDKDRVKSESAKLSGKDKRTGKGDEEKILLEQASIKMKSGKDVEKNEDEIPISGGQFKSEKSAHISEKDKDIQKIKGGDESKSQKLKIQSEPREKKDKSENKKNDNDKLSGKNIRSRKDVEEKIITEQSDVKKKNTFDDNNKYDVVKGAKPTKDVDKEMLEEPSHTNKEKIEAEEKNEDKIPISGGQLISDKSAKNSGKDKEILKIQGGDESISEKVKLHSKQEGPKAPNVSKELKKAQKKSEEPVNLKSIKIKASLTDIPKVSVAGLKPAKVPDKHIENQEYLDSELKKQQLLDKKAAEEESKRLQKEKEAQKESKNNKIKDIDRIDMKSVKIKSSLTDIPKVNVAGISAKAPEKHTSIKNQEYQDAESKKQQLLDKKAAEEESKRLQKEKEAQKASRNNKTKDKDGIDLKSIKIKSSLSDIPKVNVAGLSTKVPDKHIKNQENLDGKLQQQQLLDKRAAEEKARRLEQEKEEASKALRAEKNKTTKLEVKEEDVKGMKIKKHSLPSTTAAKNKHEKRVSLSDLSEMLISNNANMSIDDTIVKHNVLSRTTSNKAEVTQSVKPILFQTTYQTGEVSDTMILDTAYDEKKAKKLGKEPEPIIGQGVMRYALSDRTFIEKGWTLLPTEKVVRKMNVYRMRPAHPEFDWFEHNKHKGQMLYDTGERLAEFNAKGRGRWFYRNGNIALEYYDTEDETSQQRFVVFSSGEPDERGRSRPPKNILATFDNNGNGIVFDHTGKIRLKYNQTEGVVLDKSVGPVSNWKWHSLNDPPVLHQVMLDTQLPHKDARITKLGIKEQKLPRLDNAEMQAIEFDNFIKEKSKKMNETEFKPFQIKMKALKINENFSLRILDQATVHLLFRDGKTNLKLNLGMILDHTEIVDTETAEVGEVTTSVEKLPAQTDSVAALQERVQQAARAERARVEHCRRLRPPVPLCSRDRLTAAASRGPRCPLAPAPAEADCPAALAHGGHCGCHERRATTTPVYYNNQLM